MKKRSSIKNLKKSGNSVRSASTSKSLIYICNDNKSNK